MDSCVILRVQNHSLLDGTFYAWQKDHMACTGGTIRFPSKADVMPYIIPKIYEPKAGKHTHSMKLLPVFAFNSC